MIDEQYITQLHAAIAEQLPELRAILDREEDPEENMKRVQVFLQEHPEQETKLQEIAQRLVTGEALVLRKADAVGLADRQEALAQLGFEEEDLLFQSEENRLPQLHPGLQAYIMERLQFDGDIPELRTGPLPENAQPAVPVATKARTAALVGLELEEASKTVQKQLQPGTTAVSTYQPGHYASALMVQSQEQKLLTLTPKQTSEYAFKALTSTQGRKSLAPVLEEVLVEALEEGGGKVSPLRGEADEEFVWEMFIPTGPGDYNGKFEPLNIARASLKAQIQKKYGTGVNLQVQVRDHASIEGRRFGWRAQVALDKIAEM